jgi:hypothetical protein
LRWRRWRNTSKPATFTAQEIDMPRFDGEYPATTQNKPQSAVSRPVKVPPHPTPKISPDAVLALPEGQEKAHGRHPLKSCRSFTPRLRGNSDWNVVLQSENLIIPWNRFEYPGRKNGMVEAFGGAAKWTTMRGWQRTGNAPAWALRIYARLIEDRLIKHHEVLDRLRAEILRVEALPPRAKGFCVVTNGADKRGSGGRNRKHLGGSASVDGAANPAGLVAREE